MGIFERLNFRKRTSKRSLTSNESCSSTLSTSPNEDDEDDLDLDYDHIIRQEAIGFRLEKIHRTMIGETNDFFSQYSNQCKRLVKKHKESLQKKNGVFQTFSTTVKLSEAALSTLEQFSTQLDGSIKVLNDISPNPPECTTKCEVQNEISTLKKAKNRVDQLKREKEQLNSNFNRVTDQMNSCQVDTKKWQKLQRQKSELSGKKKVAKKNIKEEEIRFREVKRNHRISIDKLTEQTHKNEIQRLTDLQELLTKFVSALKLDSTSFDEAKQGHNPLEDISAWEEKNFSFSAIESAV